MTGKTNEEILGLMAMRLTAAIQQHGTNDPIVAEKCIKMVIEANDMKAAYEADPTAPLTLHKLSYDVDEASKDLTVSDLEDMMKPVLQFYRPWILDAVKAGKEKADREDGC